MAQEKIEPERLPLTSHDVLSERMDRLRELFPEAFAEGKVDFAKLRQALGDDVDEGRERYGLSWAGKSEAIRNVQVPSTATLVPAPEAGSVASGIAVTDPACAWRQRCRCWA